VLIRKEKMARGIMRKIRNFYGKRRNVENEIMPIGGV